jgi:hypothetical protein
MIDVCGSPLLRRILTYALVIGSFTILLLVCYSPALFRNRQFGYRDAGHYYYPLYQRVQHEWHEGRWPLWEPEENAGMPLLGNPTAAVLYPGKLIYALLPYAWAARVYVIFHTVLAFIGMLILMRSWRASATACALSALSYAFGAPILFQSCNVIYLVGAAWLPLGFHGADQWVRLGRCWGVVELAIVLAMQILGGDIQSAYLLSWSAGGYAVGITMSRAREIGRADRNSGNSSLAHSRRWWLIPLILIGLVLWAAATIILAVWLPGLRPPGNSPRPFPWMAWVPRGVAAVWGMAVVWFFLVWLRRGWQFRLGPAWLGLAASVGLAITVSAAQLLPVVEFSQQTIRSAGTGPHDYYPFSIEPLRLVELAWPNFLGVPVEGNTFWRDAVRIPGVRPELWSQSLFLGGLTLLLAIGEFTLWRGPPWRVWLSVIVLVSLLGSLGTYTSPIWAARFGAQSFGSPVLGDWARSLGKLDPVDVTPIRIDRALRDGDGGFYWWLTIVLPGFRQFRFPAKLFTFTALGVAALAGLGWDRLRSPGNQRVLGLFWLFLVVSLGMLAGAWIERTAILTAFRSSVASSKFGPFDASGGFQAILRSLAQASLVAGGGLVAAHVWRRRSVWAGSIVLMVMTADLAVANARHVMTVPQAVFESKPESLRAIEDHEHDSPSGGPFRVYRMAYWEPRVWQMTASANRVVDIVAWERDTLQAKYGINLGFEYTHAFGVGGLLDFEWFFSDFPVSIDTSEAASALGVDMGRKVVYYPRRSFDIWNTRYFIVPCDPHGWREEYRAFASFLFQSEPIYPSQGMLRGLNVDDAPREWMHNHDFQILRNPNELPRAWVVHEARWVNSVAGPDRNARNVAMREMLFANDPLWHDATTRPFDPRKLAWVNLANKAELDPYLSAQPPTPTEAVRVTYPTPQRTELDVSLESPGLVILADVYYPGWELTIDGKPAPIYPVNWLMRGSAVPAGTHRLVYTYSPQSFRIGRVISMIGLGALALLCLAYAVRRADPMVAA